MFRNVIMKWTLCISMILFVAMSNHLVKGQELLFKNFARSNRASRGPDEFEKFFLKASKSVPRIGRRGLDMDSFIKDHQYCLNSLHSDTDNKFKTRCLQMLSKKYDSSLRDFSWYDLPDKVEYYPEILMSPGFLSNAGLQDLTNEKRMDNAQGVEQNKEITEYRLQPES